MSADNWRPCPQCVVKAEAEAARARAVADAAYGVKPLDEFDALRSEAKRLSDLAQEMADGGGEETFREDYSIGTHVNGHFWASYRGSCTACGYSVSFQHDQDFPPEQPAEPKPRRKART